MSEGPENDIDVPVEIHIEDLFLRLLIVSAFIVSVSLLIFPVSDQIISHIWDVLIPNSENNQPRLYSPIALILTRFKLIALFSMAASFPVIILQVYSFTKIGLYDIEKFYFKLSSVLSVVLSIIAIALSYFLFIPILFSYFTNYSVGTAELAYGLEQTVGLILSISIYLTISFQLPILMILAVTLGVVSHRWIRKRRIIFWLGFLGISALISPDPTGAVTFIITFVLVFLFELSLLVIPKLPKSDNRE
jgi:sec-independent protein translocase protein TatC